MWFQILLFWATFFPNKSQILYQLAIWLDHNFFPLNLSLRTVMNNVYKSSRHDKLKILFGKAEKKIKTPIYKNLNTSLLQNIDNSKVVETFRTVCYIWLVYIQITRLHFKWEIISKRGKPKIPKSQNTKVVMNNKLTHEMKPKYKIINWGKKRTKKKVPWWA